MQPLEFLYLNPQPADLTIVLPVVFLERSLYISVIVPFIASIILLLYLAMSAVTSAEAVAMDRSELTEDVSMLAVPELVTRGDDWVLITRVMVEVDGLCVISFCWTAGKAKVLGHPTASGRLPQLEAVVGAGPNPHHSSYSAFKGQKFSRRPNSSKVPPSPFSVRPPSGSIRTNTVSNSSRLHP